ncbi:TFIIB-type zinc ribbon-containing protein [Castellaniella ginsengisoli]
MKCPACKETDLVMSSRQNIEIDYCPQCRGVWLDRGELDKLIERSTQEVTSGTMPASRPQRQPHPDSFHGGHHKPYRKKSFWHEIFD